MNEALTEADLAELLKDELCNLKLSNIILARQLREAQKRILELEDGNTT